MFPLIMGVLKQPQKLNLLISAAILLSGLLIHWLWHPPDVREHRFVEKAFEFWILKWMLFVVTWGLLTANTDLRFVLAGNDLNSVVGIGLVAAMWKGDAYNERHTIIDLIFLFGLLFSWNFVIHPLIGAGKLWLFPSMMTSCIFIASIGYVIFARYGSSAITFLVVSVAYLFLQLPTYLIVYLHSQETDPELLKWLAAGKAFYGGLFYTLLFSRIKSSEPLQIHFPRIPWGRERLGNAATPAIGVLTLICLGIVTDLVLWAGKESWELLAGHHIARLVLALASVAVIGLLLWRYPPSDHHL